MPTGLCAASAGVGERQSCITFAAKSWFANRGARLEFTTRESKVPKGTQEIVMLYYAVVFLVIALIAGALGFFGVAGAAVGIAKILFFVFLVLFVVSLIIGRGRAI